ncbi:lipopolysaccharide biosynthesis protein [Marivivens sp. LCG002]|uniref:lipopolysaccharide biosynthesis protein n=1 Tax=Marivivens sp. LCG002 TaxID=3051171 RepID=UPI00255352DA|nr:lipopolysaccharide biosynthesis protein [Marivivens sp. LCG002]WIV50254.1 lipopolysaccharide biosynthesis protein [Marivivens sp. LCG002]
MLKDGSLSLVLRLCAAALSLGTLTFVGRAFTAEDFGYFGTVMAMLALLTPICALGWPLTLTRYISQGFFSRVLVWRALRQSLSAALLFALIGALVLREWIFALGLVILPAYVALDLMAAIFRARGSFVRALVPRDILWRGLLMIGVWVVMSFPQGQQTSMLLVLAIPPIFLMAALQMRSLRDFEDCAPMDADVARVRHRIWISTLSGTLFANLDTLAVGAFCGVEVAGGYFAASRLGSIIVFVHSAVGLAVGPRLARHHAERNASAINADLRTAALMAGVPALVLFGVFVVAGGVLLGAIAPNAEDMQIVLLLLALGQVVNGLTGPSGLFLSMSGAEAQVARVSIQSLAVGAAMILLGAAVFGPIGAAAATFAVQSRSELRLWIGARSAIAHQGGPA